MSVDLVRVPYDDPRVEQLVEQVQAEYVRRYGGPDATPMHAPDFVPPHGAFFVALRDDGLEKTPVGMGGWRRRPDVRALDCSRAAEVKRMYVAPAARSTGLARLMLRALEDSARDAGADVLVMETGLMQPEAISLYESAGYVPVEGFGYYKDEPVSRYFGRQL